MSVRDCKQDHIGIPFFVRFSPPALPLVLRGAVVFALGIVSAGSKLAAVSTGSQELLSDGLKILEQNALRGQTSHWRRALGRGVVTKCDKWSQSRRDEYIPTDLEYRERYC